MCSGVDGDFLCDEDEDDDGEEEEEDGGRSSLLRIRRERSLNL
jgi:hypothetical protein